MFGFLEEIDRGLYERYLTLERDVKARSNSFYDAYLDLQEHFVKLVLEEQGIAVKPQDTCGAILRRAEAKATFTQVLGLDEYTYNKMQDYTLKINAHKHKGEKTVQAETVANYLGVFYQAASVYAESRGITPDGFDPGYYVSILGIFEKEEPGQQAGNGDVKKQLAEIQDTLTNITESLKKSQNAATKPQGSNPLQEEIDRRKFAFSLKSFIKRSVHEYVWVGAESDFEKAKSTTIPWILVSIAMMLLSTIVTSVSLGRYSTFTLIENIWLILALCLWKYTSVAEKRYLTYKYAENSALIFEPDADGVLRWTVYKKKYKWFFVLSCLSCICNFISILAGGGAVPALAAILELLTLSANIFAAYKVADFFAGYGLLRFTGMNEAGTAQVSLIFEPILNELHTEEEYVKKFPGIL